MSSNNGAKASWTGHQPLPNLPSLVAESLKVINIEGRVFKGNVSVFDNSFRKSRRFSWTATYGVRGRWDVSGYENGSPNATTFDKNVAVNYELSTFINDRLNIMRSEGDFNSEPKVPEQLSPKAMPTSVSPLSSEVSKVLPPHLPEPIKKDDSASSTQAVALPGAIDLAPPMLVVRIPVNRIRPNPEQPRKTFRASALRELAESMKADTQCELIKVIRVDGDPNADYELITGERRWRAAKIGGITFLKAEVRSREEVPDRGKQHRLCLIADSHREGYTKLEMALALLTEKRNGATVPDLCKICCRSDAWVYQHLALNDLVPELLALVSPNVGKKRTLDFSIACRLARLPADRQMEVYRKVMAVTGSRLRLMEAKRLIAELLPEKPVGRRRKPADHVTNLSRMVPRCAADALTVGSYADNVFDSLVAYSGPERVETILKQAEQAISGLQALKEKVLSAQIRHSTTA